MQINTGLALVGESLETSRIILLNCDFLVRFLVLTAVFELEWRHHDVLGYVL